MPSVWLLVHVCLLGYGSNGFDLGWVKKGRVRASRSGGRRGRASGLGRMGTAACFIFFRASCGRRFNRLRSFLASDLWTKEGALSAGQQLQLLYVGP